jgi:hypothetical protein
MIQELSRNETGAYSAESLVLGLLPPITMYCKRPTKESTASALVKVMVSTALVWCRLGCRAFSIKPGNGGWRSF